MRTASMHTADPAALSVAPVPECHESKCAPSITISSFRSVPGISATTLALIGHPEVSASALPSAGSGRFCIREPQQLLIGLAVTGRFVMGLNFASLSQQNDRAFEFAFVLVEVGFSLRVEVHGLCAQHAA